MSFQVFEKLFEAYLETYTMFFCCLKYSNYKTSVMQALCCLMIQLGKRPHPSSVLDEEHVPPTRFHST